MKQDIRSYAMGLGVDDAGFASAADYRSPKSPGLETIFPGIRSMIVLAYKELEDRILGPARGRIGGGTEGDVPG